MSGKLSSTPGVELTANERRLYAIVVGYEQLVNDLLEIIASMLEESANASS